MDNIVKAFFSEAMKNTALQSQLDPIWLRYEDAEEVSEARESLQQMINLAGMHGFKFSAAELDDVIQESMANDFLDVQSGEVELSDADLDLIAAGKARPGGGKTKKDYDCTWLNKKLFPKTYRKYCK